MIRRFMLGFVVSVGVLGACGGDDALSPRGACEGLNEVLCGKLYECLTAAQIQAAELPPTVAECVTEQNADANCATATAEAVCGTGFKYQAGKADQCLDGLEDVTCAQLASLDEDEDVDVLVPVCGMVCVASS